jgi:hypothetical protein
LRLAELDLSLFQGWESVRLISNEFVLSVQQYLAVWRETFGKNRGKDREWGVGNGEQGTGSYVLVIATIFARDADGVPLPRGGALTVAVRFTAG